MAVISNVGQIFGGQRAPSVRPAPRRDVITKAQQAQIDLSREQMAAQAAARREELAVQGVFQALGLLERGVIAGLQLSQDPPAVRAEEARADRLQTMLESSREGQAELREAEATRRVETPIAPPTVPTRDPSAALERLPATPAGQPAPAQPAPAPLSTVPQQSLASPPERPEDALTVPTPQPAPRPTPGVAPGQAIDMTSGDWEQLVANWPAFKARLQGDSEAMKKAALTLNKLGFSGDQFKGGMKQLAFLIDNAEALKAKGILNITDGPPSGYWQKLMGTGAGTTGWLAGQRAGEGVLRAKQEYGEGIFPLMEKIAALRTEDPALAERVVQRVLQKPPALARAIDEAQRSTASDPGAFDFAAAKRAFDEGDYELAARLVGPVLFAPRGTYKGKVKGLEEARERFGAAPVEGVPSEEFLYPEQGTYSWTRLQDAWAALNEAKDPRADKLLEERVVLGAMDLESIPGIEQAGSKGMMLGLARAAITGGEAERGESDYDRAQRIYQMSMAGRKGALEERRVKVAEHEARTRRIRAGKLRSRREHGAALASVQATGSVEEVREWPEYALVREHKGLRYAEKLAKWAATSNSVSKRKMIRTEAEAIQARLEKEEKKTATDAAAKVKTEADAAKTLVAKRKEWIAGKQKYEKVVSTRATALKKLRKQHGVTGDTMTTTQYVNKAVEGIKNPTLIGRKRDQAKRDAPLAVKRINAELAAAARAVKDAKEDLKSFKTSDPAFADFK